MQLGFKTNVRLTDLKPQMVIAYIAVYHVFSGLGYDVVVTSGNDSTHKIGSKHGEGNALDFRTKHVPRAIIVKLYEQIKAILGSNFDVILESLNLDNEHMHIEYDPHG